MLFWQLNTRTPQSVDTLRSELEHQRDHFLRTQHPDTVVQQMNASLAASEGSAQLLIKGALDKYMSAKPSSSHMQLAESQMNGAIDGAVALAESMTKGMRNALVLASLYGHVDEGRGDGIDQRSGMSVDFAPMPRMSRETTSEADDIVEAVHEQRRAADR